MPGYLDLNPISVLEREKNRLASFIDSLENRDGINPDASQEKIDGLISQLNLKMREYDLAILRLNTKVRIEMYSENLDKYIGLVHEAVEGRYDLSGYDLSVIEAALVQLQGEEIPDDKRLQAINGGLAEVFLRLAKHLPVDMALEFDGLREVMMKDIAKLVQSDFPLAWSPVETERAKQEEVFNAIVPTASAHEKWQAFNMLLHLGYYHMEILAEIKRQHDEDPEKYQSEYLNGLRNKAKWLKDIDPDQFMDEVKGR